MDIQNLPIIKTILAKTIGVDLVPVQPMSPPSGKLSTLAFMMGKPSGYRPGTFFTCVDNGDIFMHDGWMRDDGSLGIVMIYRKNKFVKPDSSFHVIEWTTGRGNFTYEGEVKLSTPPEIIDFITSLVCGSDSKRFFE